MMDIIFPENEGIQRMLEEIRPEINDCLRMVVIMVMFRRHCVTNNCHARIPAYFKFNYVASTMAGAIFSWLFLCFFFIFFMVFGCCNLLHFVVFIKLPVVILCYPLAYRGCR